MDGGHPPKERTECRGAQMHQHPHQRGRSRDLSRERRSEYSSDRHSHQSDRRASGGVYYRCSGNAYHRSGGDVYHKSGGSVHLGHEEKDGDGERLSKRSRYETERERSPRRRRDDEHDVKKFRHYDEKSCARSKDYRNYGNLETTADPPAQGRFKGESDWSHQRSSSERTTLCSTRERSRDRGVHNRSRTSDDNASSQWKYQRRRKYRDGSPGPSQKMRLPVGGATSSSSSQGLEVVPYTSSKANSCDDGKAVAVPPVVGTSLVPSLPLNYYFCDSDRKVSSTEALSHLHALFERDILSVGGKISPRWRLCHHDNKVTTHVQPIEDVNKKGAPLCEREEVDSGKEEGTREMDLSTEKVELSPSLSSSMLDQSPQKLTAVSSRESPPTAVSPHEQPGSSSQETTEVVNPSYQPCSSLLSEMMEKPKLHDDLCSSVPSEVTFTSKRKQSLFGKGLAVDMNINPGWYHSYAVTVHPEVNFELTGLTQIKTKDGEVFVFQGFSVLSHTPLDHLQSCRFERFSGLYNIELHRHPTMTNFTFKDALLCQEFLFVKLLELYDWVEYIRPFSTKLLFVPRFVKMTQDEQCEVLSLAEVLHYLNAKKTRSSLNANTLLTRPPGFLLFSPDKRPSCYRVDEVKWSRSHPGEVLVGHLCLQLVAKTKAQTVIQQKADKKRYTELYNKRSGTKLTRSEHFELRDLKETIERGKHSKPPPGKAGMIWLSPEGLLDFHFYHDIVQHSILLPVISHHILIYDSLVCLEEMLGYKFRDLSLLLRAVTHSSCSIYKYNVAEDHVKNALSNGGLMWYESLEAVQRPKKLKDLIEDLEEREVGAADEGQRLQNNEQLEYLGDALLEYLCSLYLYLKYPQYSVGQLVKNRQGLVKNHFLQQLAKKLNIQEFVLHNKKVGLSVESFHHFSGNCIETLLGAVFLDGGIEEAKKLFGRLAFSETESDYEAWMNPGVDPVQSEYLEGDRHLINEHEIFKSMVCLEEKCGYTFHHISLLTRAFTHSSHQDTRLTKGNYQRLEFLGDAILQFLVSKHVYFLLPAYNEGYYSMVRTALVHNKHLASLCQELGFHEFIVCTENKKEEFEISGKIMADVVESFLGALTLDQGLDVAEKFLGAHLFPKLSTLVKGSQLIDASTRLHQAVFYTCKQQGIKTEVPIYKKLPTGGTLQNPVHTIAVHYGNKEVARGSGATMKEARCLAAENALKSGMFRLPPSQMTESTHKRT